MEGLASAVVYGIGSLINAASLALPVVPDKEVVHRSDNVPNSNISVEPVTYENAQVWRTMLRSEANMKMFQDLSDDGVVSLWALNPKRTDYLVFEKDRTGIHRQLMNKGLNHTVLIMNVQRRIDAGKIKPVPWTDVSLRKGHRLDFQSYPTIRSINEYYEFVNENFPSIANVKTIGFSVEKRPIKMIRISNGNPRNKPIVLLGGQHAREWIGIISLLYIANNIVTKFDQQPEYMTNKDWYIIPLVNPDGYEYTQTHDRLWRKNRRVNTNIKCHGVDINRNYPKHWERSHVTEHNPCKEDYAGPSPLSEPETVAVSKMLEGLGGKIPSAFIDFHSYGQLIMYPWSVEAKASPHKDYLISTAEAIKMKIKNISGRIYTHGTATRLLYSASGTAIDWFHDKGIPLSYAIEGRDTGTHGFLLPASYIENSAKEMLGAVRTLANILDPDVTMRDGLKRSDWF